MNDSTPEDSDQLSRRQAAEQLTDVAYALMTGGPLTFGGRRQGTVPIPDELVLKRSETTSGDCITLKLELSWSTAKSVS